MDIVKLLSKLLPVVKSPKRMLSIQERLKWTFIVIVLYFILSAIPLYGISEIGLERFRALSLLFGGNLGSIITLGISPIVMAAIILQLLVGGGILQINMQTPEGRAYYNELLRALIVVFALFESIVQVVAGPVVPESPIFIPLLILQLFIGVILITILDDLCLKWGITSGINLFILAAISKRIFTRLFGLEEISPGIFVGAIPNLIANIGNLSTVNLELIKIIATFAVLSLAAYLQALQIEIPLTFARIRGRSFRWPIKFLYTSVIPVILLYSFWALMVLAGIKIYEVFGNSASWLVVAENGAITGGLLSFFYPQNLALDLARGVIDPLRLAKATTYLLFYTVGGAALSYLWVHAAGMDPASLAQQLQAAGLTLMGYRRDPRVIERLLERYIIPVSIWGGAAVGFLAAIANILGAVAAGTALLLAVMIAYNLYEDFARQNVLHLLPLVGEYLKKK